MRRPSGKASLPAGYGVRWGRWKLWVIGFLAIGALAVWLQPAREDDPATTDDETRTETERIGATAMAAGLAIGLILRGPRQRYNLATGKSKSSEDAREIERAKQAELEREWAKKNAAVLAERERLRNLRSTIGDLHALTPRQLEHLVARVFERAGYVAKVTKTTGDYGADVVLVRDGVTTIVEVKQHADPAGPAIVQRALGALHHYDAVSATVVCLGGFTPNAREVARRAPLTLWDGETLARETTGLDLAECRKIRD